MGDVEFELVRTIRAPAADVFARLADVEATNEWMPHKGSIRRSSRKTSIGPPGPGTTYEDVTLFGTTPGTIVEYEPPRRLLYHWWDSTASGRINVEGWPGYTLEAVADDETLVRHDARVRTNGIYHLATPVMKRIALRERAAVLDALEASFP